MALDVTVLRVFTDANGDYGNPLGVVDASLVAPTDRQRVATELGYSETIFIDLPESGAPTATAHIFTPTVELPFAGHPTVGASWWLAVRGTPVKTLQVPAGLVQTGHEERPDGDHYNVVTHRQVGAFDMVCSGDNYDGEQNARVMLALCLGLEAP